MKKLEAVPVLLAVIAAAILAFLVLRAVASPFYGRLDTRVANLTGHVTAESRRVIAFSALSRKMGTILLALLRAFCAVFLAPSAGYAIMLYTIGRAHVLTPVPHAHHLFRISYEN